MKIIEFKRFIELFDVFPFSAVRFVNFAKWGETKPTVFFGED
jgi:hypothetical protein